MPIETPRQSPNEAPNGAPGTDGLHSARLASDTDLEGFRHACRWLVAQGVAPQRVTWESGVAAEADLFGNLPLANVDANANANANASEPTPPLRVPAAFAALCASVILHRDPARFGLLYRLLWRFQHEPGLRRDPLDPDRMAASCLAHAVHRDLHKMKAFVRFTRIEPERKPEGDDGGSGASPPAALPLHVAWFEPEHHIVEAVAPFFMRRFTQMRWAILTPERCVRWNGAQLEFSPGAGRDEAPAPDAGELLWLTYYRNIFNPARLKLKMMQKEMPKRYWKNLPEAALIAPLSAQAHQRTAAMIEAAPTVANRRRVVFSAPIALHTPARALPNTLAELRAATDRCRACPISEHATQSVVGEGPLPARLMFVGEQPGDQEDLRGRPFVGPAGKLFDRALGELGWARDAVYVTNAVKHFKYELRGKRRIHKTPSQQEAAACLDWLEREIALAQPAALVALGGTAARSLLGVPVAVMQERGRWRVRADGRRVLITLHPSALLRTEPAEREAAYQRWLEDLRLAAAFAPAAGSGDRAR